MKEIEYSSLPGFSKLFLDFIAENKHVKSRITASPNEKSINDILLYHSKDFDDREVLINLAQDGIKGIQLHQSQSNSIVKIKNEDFLFIAGCLKPAFLGGTMSKFLKIHSVINFTKSLNSNHKNLHFIPLIIVEDDDIDNLEASQAAIFDDNFNVRKFSCVRERDKQDKTTLSNRKFDTYTNMLAYSLDEILPDNQFKSGFLNTYKKIYVKAQSWSDGFNGLLSEWFGSYGLLFVKASTMRQSGLFDFLILKEINAPGESYSKLVQAKSLMQSAGYDIKDKAFDINLYFHENQKRFKIQQTEKHDTYKIGSDVYIYKDIPSLMSRRKHSFSPTVILKHLFYSNILPIAAFVVSPSELGYLSLTKELFTHHKTYMPAVIPRHSATFLNKKRLEELRHAHKDHLSFNHVFPDETLQERVISPAYFISLCGIEKFNNLCESVVALPYNKHYSVEVE